jgi:dCMP deaminase
MNKVTDARLYNKQKRYDSLYMDIAIRYSEMSYAQRRQVGSVIIKDGTIISAGYNGMPHGMDNKCETDSFLTRPEVLHAEANAIMRLTRSTTSSIGATMYCTLSPCIECSKLIYQAGITRLVYLNKYKCHSGIRLLEKLGVKVKLYK